MSDATTQDTTVGGTEQGEKCGSDGPKAKQPKAPLNTTCAKVNLPTEPAEPKPTPCKPPDCDCPASTTPTESCLAKMIEAQSSEILKAEHAAKVKESLVELQKGFAAGTQAYTTDAYGDLLQMWKDLDVRIAETLRRLECQVKCWSCLVECHLCPLILEIRDREEVLEGKGALIDADNVRSLRDLLYWRERDLANKTAALGRVKNVLDAWQNPADSIRKVIEANGKVIDEASFKEADLPGLLFDLFMKVVPTHLAVAPPATVAATVIPEKFTVFCDCDVGTPDDCCGPDVGVRSVRGRLVEPLPYLVDPTQYEKLICCLVENRYRPLQEAYSNAKAARDMLDEKIKRYAAEIDEKLAGFEKAARAALPAKIDCNAAYGTKQAPTSPPTPAPAPAQTPTQAQTPPPAAAG